MYYVIYGFLYALSLLPLRVLFLLSDLAYLLIYRVFGYRKKVVMQNLSIAFPNKTEEDRKKIAAKFYRNLTDTFVETIKLISASPTFVNRHMTGDYSIFQTIYEQGKKCQIHTGHNFNWELSNAGLALNMPQKLLVVYMPLESKIFDKIFMRLRMRFGSVMLSAKDMRNSILPHRGDIYTLGLVADQSPANPRAGYWVNFFGRPTIFVKAPENGARIANIPVVFMQITRRKRGYYQIHFEMGEEHPAQLERGVLTKRYVQYLERVIGEHPEMWLWSHRRWKLDWKEEYGKVL